MIRSHLLYNKVIESDGHEHQEETFLGAVLAFVAIFVVAAIGFTLLYFAAPLIQHLL